MSIQVIHGDCRKTLKDLPDNSVHCVVTSPPYWALRSYLKAGDPLKSLEIGSEPTPEAFIATMVQVFAEVRRVLHPSGTCWINIGDSYNAGTSATRKASANVAHGYWENGGSMGDQRVNCKSLKTKDLCLIPERLALALQRDGWWVRSRIAWCKKATMPESVTDRPTSAWEHIWMFAKSERYFWDAEAVRQPLQECSEKRQAYGYKNMWGAIIEANQHVEKRTREDATSYSGEYPTTGANLRNFWLLGPSPYSDAHFATYPPEIPKRAILAGSSARGCCPKCLAPWGRVMESRTRYEGNAARAGADPESIGANGKWTTGGTHGNAKLRGGPVVDTKTLGWQPTCECYGVDPLPDYPPEPKDITDDSYTVACDKVSRKRKRLLNEWTSLPVLSCTILDPFGGSGTTAAVALELGRSVILCELNPDYLPMIQERTAITPGLPLA